MPIATKAYILKIDTPISHEYADITAKSCDDVGLKWEYFMGYHDISAHAAFLKTGIKLNLKQTVVDRNPKNSQEKAGCCTAGHFAIWKKIAEGPDQAAVVLEHDAIMLQPMNINIPDDVIAVLGYKLGDPSKYDHIEAGPPKELLPIEGHEGAHAYAMTKKTAQFLINEMETRGVLGAIDNAYFIKKQRKTAIPLKIVSPTPAMGWLRKSTIWATSAHRNYTFIPSFSKFYK